MRGMELGTRTGAVLVACLVGATACGSGTAEPGSPSAATSSASALPPASLGGCVPDDPAITDAREVVDLDLDGDGEAEALRASTGEPCPDIVYAETGEGLVAGELSQGLADVRVLTVPALDAQLFTTRETHPRGGFQVRVHALRGSEIVELVDEGASLVPFVATDVTGVGASARCAPDATLVVSTVRPAGAGEAADVVERRYRVEDGAVTASEPVTVAEGLTQAELTESFPDLARHSMFANC